MEPDGTAEQMTETLKPLVVGRRLGAVFLSPGESALLYLFLDGDGAFGVSAAGARTLPWTMSRNLLTTNRDWLDSHLELDMGSCPANLRPLTPLLMDNVRRVAELRIDHLSVTSLGTTIAFESGFELAHDSGYYEHHAVTPWVDPPEHDRIQVYSSPRSEKTTD